MQNSTNFVGRVLRSARAKPLQSDESIKRFSAYPPNDLTVEHDEEGKRFLIRMGTDCAEILYEKVNNTLDFHHTEVPLIFRGHGVAAILAQAAFKHVKEKDMKMKLTCEYLQKYMKENGTEDLRKRLA